MYLHRYDLTNNIINNSWLIYVLHKKQACEEESGTAEHQPLSEDQLLDDYAKTFECFTEEISNIPDTECQCCHRLFQAEQLVSLRVLRENVDLVQVEKTQYHRPSEKSEKRRRKPPDVINFGKKFWDHFELTCNFNCRLQPALMCKTDCFYAINPPNAKIEARMPKYSQANGMFVDAIPEQLQNFNCVEKKLLSIVRGLV